MYYSLIISMNKVLPANPLWDSLLSYYTGDNTPNDSKGVANATLYNGVTYATGKINNGFSLDGVNDYLTFGSNLDFDGATPFSYSFWINTAQTNGALFRNIDPNLIGPGYIFYILSSKIEFLIQNSSSNRLYIKTVDSLASGWNLVNITYDGSKNASGVKIYFNGVNKTLTTITNTFTLSSYVALGGVGLGYTVSSIAWLNAIVDEIGIWSKVLTATEVIELYNSGSGKQYPL